MEVKVIILFLLQYRDQDLPDLQYGPRHTLIENTVNNTRGDLPFTTPGEKVLSVSPADNIPLK